jgi:hypothetical protein
MSTRTAFGDRRILRSDVDLAVTGVLFVVAALGASYSSAHEIFPIGNWHGVGVLDVAAGCLLGGFGGAWIWRAGRARLEGIARVVAAVAAASALAAVPAQVHQSVHLTVHYARMNDATAARIGGSQVPSVRGQTEVFDRLRSAIPPGDSYVLYGDWAFALWAHTWLLPRVDADSPRDADWAIFHYRSPAKSGLQLADIRRIGQGTWIGRIAR